VVGDVHNPSDLKQSRVRPLAVAALPEVIALKAMSGRARDDADIAELLKRHPSRVSAVSKSARARLQSEEARQHFDAVVDRAKDEIRHRR
jgi:hypothetical protein